MSTILYAIVAKDQSPLAEVALAQGNFQTMAMKLLTKVRPDTSVSYSYENQYIFHYHNERNITFLCMTDAGFAKRSAYEFLFDVRDRFFTKYGVESKTLLPHSIEREFADEMKGRIHYYNSDPSSDRIRTVKANIDRTKDIMIENIDKVLARGEKIEMLVMKTQQMSEDAISLRKTAVSVKRHMWWKNVKFQILLVVIILLVLFFIVVLGCGGFAFPNCA
mmetsp:Transcript_18667/g.33756  ORF Transcript_18667/g.33756 Transcript_18667/m.33756 type:complete len:220 (+) Transcript_18667:685-1344(+)